MHTNANVWIKKVSKMLLISIIIKAFAITFYKNRQTCLETSDRIKDIFNLLISQMIILVCTMIYHALKECKNNAHIIKKFENEFIIDEWFQFWKKITILLIFEKWFNSQTTSDTFVRKKNRRVYKTCWKNKARTAKIYFEIDQSKKKRSWRTTMTSLYTFFTKIRLTI